MTERQEQMIYDEGYRKGYEKGKADRPRGKWIDEKEVRPPFDVKIYKCSACGIYADAILASMYKFCPNCGSDNRGEYNE